MNRGLARLAMGQVVAAMILAGAAAILVPATLRDDVLAGIVAVLVAMLIGFGPLRVFLRRGPDGIVAGWIAAMIVRMAAALVGLVVLIRRFGLDPAGCVLGLCGAYVVLLIVEAIGLAGLVRREFENRRFDDAGATPRGELGER